MIAASAYRSAKTFNLADYTETKNRAQEALELNVLDLIFVDNSRLSIQQSMRDIACNKD